MLSGQISTSSKANSPSKAKKRRSGSSRRANYDESADRGVEVRWMLEDAQVSPEQPQLHRENLPKVLQQWAVGDQADGNEAMMVLIGINEGKILELIHNFSFD